MNSPKLIQIEATDTIESAVAKITLQPDVIILLLGNFDAPMAPQVRSICARALAPIALMTNAVIVDDGAKEGLAAMMGEASQEVDRSPVLLGIVGANVAEFDTNHSLLVRMPQEWTDPAKSAFLMVAGLSKDGQPDQRPVVAILIGGGDAEKLAILRCARRGWPIFAAQGAGGLGDELLALNAAKDDPNAVPIPDPQLSEIIDIAAICPLSLSGNVDDLKRVLIVPILQPVDALIDAWKRYDDLDLAAVDKQDQFRTIQFAILSLAVFATLLAVAVSSNALPPPYKGWLLGHVPALISANYVRVLRVLLILVPISTSILTGFNSRFREGNKWVLLRAAAESVKREIFRYRARACAYSAEQCRQDSAPSKLAANIKDITSSLAQSEVNRTSLPHRPGNDTARVAFLKPEEYLHQRITDQADYFVKKTKELYSRLTRLQLYILLAGGLGTFLAAIHFEVWVALTTALATAITTKLEIDQVENSLVQYNVALTNLRNIASWWTSLSVWEKSRRKNIDLLVDQAEKTLERETAGWVQQMQSALDKLTEKQSDAGQTSAAGAKQ